MSAIATELLHMKSSSACGVNQLTYFTRNFLVACCKRNAHSLLHKNGEKLLNNIYKPYKVKNSSFNVKMHLNHTIKYYENRNKTYFFQFT